MLVSIKGNVPELHPKAVVSIASLVLVSQNCKLLHSTGAVFFFFFFFLSSKWQGCLVPMWVAGEVFGLPANCHGNQVT